MSAAADSSRESLRPGPRPADVLVVFGISGDLAKVMTFRSLYRLERRGLLACPIVGVAIDDWTVNEPREHAPRRSRRLASGSRTMSSTRLAARLSYLSGDFVAAATHEGVGKATAGASLPCRSSTWRHRRRAGLSEAGLTKTARILVEKPFGHDLASARALAAQLHEYVGESQLYRACGTKIRPTEEPCSLQIE